MEEYGGVPEEYVHWFEPGHGRGIISSSVSNCLGKETVTPPPSNWTYHKKNSAKQGISLTAKNIPYEK